MLERLSKVLARAGVASRRGAEKLLAEGRVTVNGAVAREPGVRVDAERDAIKLDGRRLGAPPAVRTYLMLNKPRGYVTTLSDPQQRPTVRDLLRGVKARVYPVGRLDYHTEGLLLLTDDGELARDLMHPRSGVKKTYRAKVRGRPLPASLERLRQGVVVEVELELERPIGDTPAASEKFDDLIEDGIKFHHRPLLTYPTHECGAGGPAPVDETAFLPTACLGCGRR